MELVDTDGDNLQFLISRHGTISEYVNGKLDCKRITVFDYSRANGKVTDDTGEFFLRPEDRTSKALGLRALAGRAGILWRGDEPELAKELTIVDTDGDRIDFRLTQAGKLEEHVNGDLEISDIRKLHFNLSAGLINDQTGEIGLPTQHCIENAAVLRSMAQQAGVMWVGDEPGLPVVKPEGILDIENSADNWVLECTKRWDDLAATDQPSERHCATCNENVHFSRTEEELAANTAAGRCVAFDVQAESSEVEHDETGEPKVEVRVALLSGQEFFASIKSSDTVGILKTHLAASSGIPEKEQKLLLRDNVLQDGLSLVAAGVTCETLVQLVRVPLAIPEKMPPRVRKMGKRRKG
eukprot:TRINITY_DN71171_c0_g1_i1.p1 TRINITY_DN71171_c0_g1~~TRINITY_DN71171_c0_g1_i1.p1  ORF type:complete len:353 (-),score=63.64 TRINITY_DN71171_c0_g1_i1:35-1093(-)